jgi:hypothetical protein
MPRSTSTMPRDTNELQRGIADVQWASPGGVDTSKRPL